MREATTPAVIKSVIKKMDTINRQDNELSAVEKRTYANVMKGGQNFRDRQQLQMKETGRRTDQNFRNNPRMESVRCWTCSKMGHYSRECVERRKLRCYGCGIEGHIQRDCERSNCNLCKRRGHTSNNCFQRYNHINSERVGNENMRDWHQIQRYNTEYVRPNFINYSDRYRSFDERNKYQIQSSNKDPKANNGRQELNNQNRDRMAAIDNRESGYNIDDDDTKYPNETAPSAEEMIGAIY